MPLTNYLFIMLNLAVLTLVSCSKTESTEVASTSIYATYTVSEQNLNIVCEATFQVGGSGGTYLELVDNDKAYCNGKRMRLKSSQFNIMKYSATVTRDPEDHYQFVLERSSGERFVSTAELPPQIEVKTPVKFAELDKDQQLIVEWTPAQETYIEAELRVRGDSSSYITSSPESGTLALTPAFSAKELQNSDPCSGVLALHRYYPGKLASGLDGGSIDGVQIVEIPVVFKAVTSK